MNSELVGQLGKITDHFESEANYAEEMADAGLFYSRAVWVRMAIEELERSQWVPVSERLPDDGQNVIFQVKVNPDSNLYYLNGRVLGGRFNSALGNTFSVPGLSLLASRWMPAPEGVKEGGE